MKDDLALFGGKPIVKHPERLRVSWPLTGWRDFRAIKKVFRDKDFSGRGSKRIYDLEKRFQKLYPGYYATALNSGTAALHLALASLDIKPGDEVIVPALTFVATAMSVLHNQSIPVFADIDPLTYNISPVEIEKKITSRTKAIIIVHLHGLPCDMKTIVHICKKHNIKLIEDVAQAPLATYNKRLVGSFGDAAAFSLMSQKNIPSCGECGILLTKTREAKNRAERFRIYGEILKPGGQRVYNSLTLGWNYTLSPMEAAMALVQIDRAPTLTKKIQKNARYLTESLKRFNWIKAPLELPRVESVFHFYRFGLDPHPFGYSHTGRFRAAIEDALAAEGLTVRHYQNTPVPGQLIFQQKNLNSILPWSLAKRSIKYSIRDYPHTLESLRSSLVLGAIGASFTYLLKKGTIKKYIRAFQKIESHMDEIICYAKKMDYHDPWYKLPVTSDSYQANYEIFI